MSSDPGGELRARLRADLIDAMKARRTDEIAVLRALVAAIDNAEAPAVGPQPNRGGAGEIARLLLTPIDLDTVLRAEIDARTSAAAEFAALGEAARADALLAQAAVVRRYLAPVQPQ